MVTVRAPFSTSAIGRSRLRMQSSQLRWWPGETATDGPRLPPRAVFTSSAGSLLSLAAVDVQCAFGSVKHASARAAMDDLQSVLEDVPHA